jgi:5-methylcytosine-specific restriction enzyme subunit McrC
MFCLFYRLNFRRINLNLLYSYLRNIETKTYHPLNKYCEGALLYPTVNHNLNESYQIGSHKLVIRTVNLGNDWRNIYQELRAIIN